MISQLNLQALDLQTSPAKQRPTLKPKALAELPGLFAYKQ
jgi:hypothetical protein